jgi:hypothetical protein
VVEFGLLGSKTDFDSPQAFTISELGKSHAKERYAVYSYQSISELNVSLLLATNSVLNAENGLSPSVIVAIYRSGFAIL